MARKTQTINLQQFYDSNRQVTRYRVVSLTNRVEPAVGQLLTERDVRDLIALPATKVNIQAAK